MSPPRASLSSFLRTAKSHLSNPQKTPLTFIIGNESADLDSLLSAILLAYLRTYTPSSSTFYIPLSNLPSADLSLRPELSPVLLRARLRTEELLTVSDLPEGLEKEGTKWVLVDHNKLQGVLGGKYGGRVVGCVDHHDEENAVPQDVEGEPRIVEKSGSCTSLVVRYCREAWDELSAQNAEGDKELASLAMGAVVVDTTNLTSEDKTTDVDIEAVAYLEGKGAESGEDRERYSEEIQKAKEDLGKMSLNGILRKDYKQWTEGQDFVLGVSSVVRELGWLIEHAGGEDKFLAELERFAKERELDVASVMTTSHKGGVFRRELLLWGLNERGTAAAKRFEEAAKEKLGMKSWREGKLDGDEGSRWRKCWWQDRVESSRKQVAPLLRAAMKG